MIMLAAVALASSPALEPVPAPEAALVEPTVYEPLAAAHAALAEDRPDADRAEAHGDFGRLALAYELHDMAAPAFGNAARLTPEDHRWPYYRGVLARAAGDLDAAAEDFRRALALVPRDHADEGVAIFLRLGDVELARGGDEAAKTAYAAALAALPETAPSAAAAHYGLARLAARAGEAEAAVEHFERTLALQPEASQARYPLALALRKLGRAAAARDQIARRGDGRVEFVDPLVAEVEGLATGTSADVARGEAAMLAGRPAEAVEHYRRAVAASPEDYDVGKAFAVALYQAGKLDEARVELERLLALELDEARRTSEHAFLHFTLGTLLVNQKNDVRALVAFRDVLALEPEHRDALFHIAGVYGRSGLFNDAVEHLDRLLELEPGHGSARLRRATTLMDLRRYSEALPDLRWLLEREPRGSLHHLRLAGALQWLGEVEAALEEYRRALELGLPNPQAELFARVQLGRMLEERGSFAAALAEYERAVTLGPTHPEALRGHARMLLRLERDADARTALEKGVAARPDEAALIFYLARLLALAPDPLLRDGERALELAEKLRAAAPTAGNIATVAMAHAQLGDFTAAAEHQGQAIAVAEARGRTDVAERLREALASYAAGKIWRPATREAWLP